MYSGGPGFKSQPGVLCCMILPLSPTCFLSSLELYYQYNHINVKKYLKNKKRYIQWTTSGAFKGFKGGHIHQDTIVTYCYWTSFYNTCGENPTSL